MPLIRFNRTLHIKNCGVLAPGPAVLRARHQSFLSAVRVSRISVMVRMWAWVRLPKQAANSDVLASGVSP